MILYRVKQFFWNFSFKLSEREKKYLLDHLEQSQRDIFSKLSIGEQKHSIRVAIDLEEYCNHYKTQGKNLDKDRLLLAALLHDIGKSYKKLNVIDKSVIVILNKLTKGKLRKYQKIKKLDVYYNHAKKGADILRKYKYDERIIYLVENHHKNIKDDLELSILIKCDSSN